MFNPVPLLTRLIRTKAQTDNKLDSKINQIVQMYRDMILIYSAKIIFNNYLNLKILSYIQNRYSVPFL